MTSRPKDGMIFVIICLWYIAVFCLGNSINSFDEFEEMAHLLM